MIFYIEYFRTFVSPVPITLTIGFLKLIVVSYFLMNAVKLLVKNIYSCRFFVMFVFLPTDVHVYKF